MRNVVLIVDDEPLLRMQMAALVESIGLVPVEAEGTLSAMAELAQQSDRIVAVLTDINMPGTRDGVVLANQIRFGWPDIRVIVISGSTAPHGDLGAEIPFYQKPVSPSSLASALTF